jgi:hypothetical protein
MAHFISSSCGVMRLALSATTLATLAACGGGAGGGDTDGTTLAAKLRLAGMAASATAALTGQTVAAKCGGASGSTTSGADGGYVLEIDNAMLPCMLEVSTAGGATLHSVAVGSGAEAQANINPVTELIVASATAADPAVAFQSFDAGAAAALTAPVVQAATTTVTSTLATAGVDLSAAGSPLTTTSTAGLAAALQTLDTTLAASGTSLTTLTTSVAQTSPQATTPPPANASPLPAAQLLQPAAANCSALRSGTYRFIGMAATPAGQMADSETFSVDAQALTFQFSDGATEAITATGTCRYAATGLEIAVSLAGVMAIRWQDDTNAWRGGIAFPEQNHAPSAMAGNGGMLGVDISPGGGVALWTQARTNAAPVVGTVSETWNLTLNNQYPSPSAIGESKNTIASVDEATKGFVRDSVINFATGATRPETMKFNSPSDGFTYRTPGSVQASDGSTSNVSEFLALGLRGMGVSGVIIKSNNSLILSVGKVAP